jgi:hemoglobin
MEKKKIAGLEEVKTLVNAFYAKVREDELLAGIFNAKIGNRWPEHLEKMYRFWQTVLLEEHTYSGSPFLPHAKLPVAGAHFDRWQELFNKTVDENFIGEKAEEAKKRAGMMATMFHHKIEYYKTHATTPLK